MSLRGYFSDAVSFLLHERVGQNTNTFTLRYRKREREWKQFNSLNVLWGVLVTHSLLGLCYILERAERVPGWNVFFQAKSVVRSFSVGNIITNERNFCQKDSIFSKSNQYHYFLYIHLFMAYLLMHYTNNLTFAHCT